VKKVKKGAAFERVRRMGAALPDVEEGTAYGSPALKVGGRMFACIAVNRSAEADTLAVRLSMEQRDELMAADPNIYYLTEHYVDYPCVLVRLARIPDDALQDLLAMGHRFMSTSRPRSSRSSQETGHVKRAARASSGPANRQRRR
jgi:hypothetical protein